ncbi:hypothetical protein Sjap_013157 [Stephania japonica]|uniref:DUF674 domain-containing protein n=1 Tax=Stephania japonica TaxID=461633 RepID=A0AAP0IYL1_9MAGN
MTTQKPITLKLLVDNKSNRVLFAEAKKDFVDFLLALSTLPLGSITRFLTTKDMVGSFGDLYDSVENLEDAYMQPNVEKDAILKPVSAASFTLSSSTYNPLSLPSDSVATIKYYRCAQYAHLGISSDPQSQCPYCKSAMSTKINYVLPKTADQGFVKGATTFMVTDSLKVTPMSAISSISVLKGFNIPDLTNVHEMEVNFGMQEGMKLLRAALQSKTALSDVFLWEEIQIEMLQLGAAHDGKDHFLKKVFYDSSSIKTPSMTKPFKNECTNVRSTSSEIRSMFLLCRSLR